MEIKKYVLLKNNNIIEFYDNDKFGFLKNNVVVEFYENNKYRFLCVEKEGGTVNIKDALISDVKLTSDNILDLLENKDLVELKGGDGNDNDVHMIVNVIDGDMITLDKLWIYKERDRDTIAAIYKRQPNGDYKRYEVV